MSEFRSPSDKDPMQESAGAITEHGSGVIRERDFMGYKVAREFMDEFGFLKALSEIQGTAVADILGSFVRSGIVLGMKKKTDEASLQEEIERQLGILDPLLMRTIGKLVPIMVMRGAEFYRDELAQNTVKTQEWKQEFSLLVSSES